MSAYNLKDLKTKTAKELLSDLADIKKELFNLRFQKTAGVGVNTSRLRILKRGVARVKTLLNQLKTAN